MLLYEKIHFIGYKSTKYISFCQILGGGNFSNIIYFFVIRSKSFFFANHFTIFLVSLRVVKAKNTKNNIHYDTGRVV